MKNIIFAGTPEFASFHLQFLIDNNLAPSLVMTKPDRAAGRGRKLMSSPVKKLAEKNNINLFQPKKFDSKAKSYLDGLIQPDLLIVVAYGLLLPKYILEWPKYGAINVHASLLPRWRGAAPIQRAIEAGDKETGISIMQMDIGLDTGDIWIKEHVKITKNMNSQNLHDKLKNVGAESLIKAISIILDGEKTPIQQCSDGITYAKKLNKLEAKINWLESSDMICRKIKAFNPSPIAYTETNTGDIFRFFDAIEKELEHNSPVGSILSETKDGILIACKKNGILITEIQEIGKKRLKTCDFLNGKSLSGLKFI